MLGQARGRDLPAASSVSYLPKVIVRIDDLDTKLSQVGKEDPPKRIDVKAAPLAHAGVGAGRRGRRVGREPEPIPFGPLELGRSQPLVADVEDAKDHAAAAQKWLKDNAAKYRIQRLVPEKTDKK